MARFDDEQRGQYTTRRARSRREGPAAHEIGGAYAARTPKQTEKVQAQHSSSSSNPDSWRHTPPASPSRSPQSARQRIEYERYGRVRPQEERERLRQQRERMQRIPRDFHTDENPGVPKVRRASRQQNQDDISDTPAVQSRRPSEKTSAHIPIVELDTIVVEDDEDLEAGTRPTRTTTSHHAIPIEELPTRSPRRKPERRPYVPPDDLDEEPARRTYGARNVQPRTTSRQQTTRSSYVRRGRHEDTAYTQRVSSLFNVVRDMRTNRPLLITLGVFLTALVLLPLLINSITKNTSSATTVPTINQGGNGSNQVTLNRPPLDPREIIIASPDSDHPAPPVLATSAYLLDADTGATLYAYNPFMHLPMMSTTKLMTATLAIEHGNLDQRITINAQIANDLNQLSADSSVMGIKKGETYTLRELLYGLMLVSGNDAAIAIGDAIGGNLPHFVTMMNQRAQQLGLLDTHYMNPHGLLVENHYSSARDLAVLGRFAFGKPQIQQISATRSYTVPQANGHPTHVLINGNQFLWWYPGVNAGKPGWDGGNNFVQVVSVIRNGHHLIGVTMHTSDWWTDMRDLMNWGFDNFQWVSPAVVDKQNPIPYDSLWNYFNKDRQDVTIPTANGGRYYIYTGYSISGSIKTYFDQHGGLNKLGYPRGLPTPSGSNAIRQAFQHATIQCDMTNRCATI